ncbi:MAG TPA: DUF5995 family protein [Acidobacteriaceae bacterium]
MPVAPADQPLYALVTAPAPATVQQVIDAMQQIDAVLPNDDGLKWFNRLYLSVTQKVDLEPPASWQDPAWLLQLDVIFAGFYLRALAGYLSGDPSVPSSWTAMLEARNRPGVDRIQFALAGMNAHINHDLSLALLTLAGQTASAPNPASPQHADYQAVNQLLNSLMPATLQMLATDTLGVLAQDSGKIGRILAFWDICRARDLAWEFANHLGNLPTPFRPPVLDAQDQITGVLGRAILSLV